MKIAHWSEKALPSGLGETALHICEAERKLGLDSVVIDAYSEADWANADGADVHVVHLYMPPKCMYGTNKPLIWVAHGTPDLMAESSYTESAKGGYAPADGWMIAMWWLQHADVTVTFWPRHEAIWKSLSDKNTRIEGVPLGVDKDFWKPIESAGKFIGEPSVFSGENCYILKWPWDLLVSWPWVISRGLPDAKLHLVNVPYDQSMLWRPLLNRNGSGYHSFVTNKRFTHEELRNAFVSTNYYCGLVRYSDHNYIQLQAEACGAKTIAYHGNPYAAFTVSPGDQRVLAQELSAILRGEVEERKEREKPVSIQRTAQRMIEIYLSLAKDQPTGLVKTKMPKKRGRKPKSTELLPTSMATLAVQ